MGCHFLLQEIFLSQGSNPVSCVSRIGTWVLYQWATWEAQSFRYYLLKCFGGISKNKQNYLKMLSTYSFLFQIHSCKRPDILHVVQPNQYIIINWIQKQMGESSCLPVSLTFLNNATLLANIFWLEKNPYVSQKCIMSTYNEYITVIFKLISTYFLIFSLLASNMVNLWASRVVLVVNKPANAGDTRDVGSIPGLGRSPE